RIFPWVKRAKANEPRSWESPKRLHFHFARRHEIPNAPKFLHFRRSAEGNPDVGIHGRKEPGDLDIVFPEVLNDIYGHVAGFQHGKIGVRIDPAKHASVCLIEEFLAI